MPAARVGSPAAVTVIPVTAPTIAPPSLQASGVTGPPSNDGYQGPDQSAAGNDESDQQPAEQPQAQTKGDPDGDPEAEEPETDADADLQADPQARGEVFDLEAGDGRPV